jgi:DNA-binding PadR family transcriptional regulator
MRDVKTPAAPLLNATAASILGFLNLQPMSGGDLAARIEDVIGDFWNVTKSQVYRELKLLADAGLVATLRAGKRDKQPYRVTPAGRRAFVEWIAEEPGPPIMRMPLVLQVFFGDAVDRGTLARSLAKLRAYHASRLEAYRGFERDIDKKSAPYQALVLGMRYQRLMVDWIDSVELSGRKVEQGGATKKARG